MLKSIFIGVDVSKDKLDIYLNPLNKSFQVKNSTKEVTSFVEKLKKDYKGYDVHIGMESTARYHSLFFKITSLSSDFKVSVINPKKVFHFIKAYGDLAKTDSLDAKLIASYVEKMKPEVTLYDGIKERLQSLVTRRRQLVRFISQQKTQIEQFKGDKDIISSSKVIMKTLQKELIRIEEIISSIQDSNEEIKRQKEIITSVPGIGKVSSMILCSYLPELGKATTEEIASLVGVAPKSRDSGLYKGERRISGGRLIVRDVLYMAAIASIRHKNNNFYVFYDSLRKKGKPAKVALIAVSRKLLITLNAMLKNEKLWDKKMVYKVS